MSALSENIKKLRLENYLTQKELASKLDLAISAVSSYELGTRLPSYDVLIRLAKLFDVTTDYLLGLSVREYVDVTDLNKDEIDVIKKMVQLLRQKNSN